MSHPVKFVCARESGRRFESALMKVEIEDRRVVDWLRGHNMELVVKPAYSIQNCQGC